MTTPIGWAHGYVNYPKVMKQWRWNGLAPDDWGHNGNLTVAYVMECLQMFGSLNMGKYQWMTPFINSNLTVKHCLHANNVVSHQILENVKVGLLCHTLQHFCLHFVTRVWQFDIFFFSPKFGLKNQKHCCKFAQCRQRQKIIVGNQLVYSICLKCIPSLVTKCWCLCQSHKEVIEVTCKLLFKLLCIYSS
jgi:hypothetical protein